MFHMSLPRRLRGFTLIELMIAVAVVAILTAIALPSYQTYIRKSRRADAKTALLDLAAREERYFTLNNSYTNLLANLSYGGIVGNTVTITSNGTPDYVLSVTAFTATTYSAQAAAQGDQVNDACGTYQLDNFGNQTVTGAGANCW
jgi:type IV pilus assembly protein PilE